MFRAPMFCEHLCCHHDPKLPSTHPILLRAQSLHFLVPAESRLSFSCPRNPVSLPLPVTLSARCGFSCPRDPVAVPLSPYALGLLQFLLSPQPPSQLPLPPHPRSTLPIPPPPPTPAPLLYCVSTVYKTCKLSAVFHPKFTAHPLRGSGKGEHINCDTTSKITNAQRPSIFRNH